MQQNGIPLLLFACHDSVHESLGFTPFELVFGQKVRGPVQALKDSFLSDDDSLNILDFVSKFKEKLLDACQVAKENLEMAQDYMKTWYDRKSKTRSFKEGERS